MNNKQYYKCDRNHYFFGKLMTVRDFQSEQTYFNSKRRMGNRMLNGAGIVSGLNVILVDNKTFSLETGLALDYMGREIVVPETSVRRLNVLKGFEENKDKGIVYLCIEYKEDLKETTFSVAGSGKSSGVSEEFNRISEGYELFLTSEPPDVSDIKIDGLFNRIISVYKRDGLGISLEIPKYVNPGNCVKISVIFEKENIEAPIKYSFDVKGEFFNSLKGERGLNIDYQETEITTYKRLSREYFMYCNASTDASAELFIPKESFKVYVGSEEFKIDDDIKIPINIKTEPIKDLIVNDYYTKRFDEIIDNVDNKYIYLAKFHIVTNHLTYFIEGFVRHPFQQYIYSNDLLRLLQEVGYDGGGKSTQVNEEIEKIEDQEYKPKILDLPEPKIDNIVTGVERINLGFNPKVGRTYYSYEFVHGLGNGNVAVVTAIDNKANYLTDDKGILVFGDKSIFSKEEISISSPNVQIAAVSNSEKGTIRLGIRLQEKTTAQAVDIRWWAFKPIETERDDDLVIDENVRVVITPNTIRVKPLEQVRLQAHIEGSGSQEIRWEMAENNTGTIDNNGLYTAPSKEGVYEVKAYSIKYENKSDSAYVVVSSME